MKRMAQLLDLSVDVSVALLILLYKECGSVCVHVFVAIM